jgi:hypothetical protein
MGMNPNPDKTTNPILVAFNDNITSAFAGGSTSYCNNNKNLIYSFGNLILIHR